MIVEFSSVDFSYGKELLLKDVSFTIAEGEIVCLVGPNGSGKTTIVRLILGLLSPVRGKIQVMERSAAEARAAIGYVPQSLLFDSLFPITVWELVSYGRVGGWAGRLDKEDRRAINRALELTGLVAQADELFASLSGGQRQRALIARALSHEWRLLIMDEPSANVDQETRQSIITMLSHFSPQQTALLISHDTDFVSNPVQKVLCVNQQVVEHSLYPPPNDLANRRKIIHD